MNISKTLRKAATLLVFRDAAAGMEVLMIQRPERTGDNYSGAWVFPGGVVEDGDRGLYSLCAGLDDISASKRLGLGEHGLDLFIAAIRECFEEAGLLLAYGPDGKIVDLDSMEETPLATLRKALQAGETNLGEVCRQLNLRLAVDQLAYHSHWLTPLGIPKRFDTRFFVAIAPPAQTALLDGKEAIQHVWLHPADALARASELKLLPPTQRTLHSLASFATASACYEHARQLRDIEVMMARRAMSSAGPRVVFPDEPAYPEIARIDPEGRGDAYCEVDYDRPVRLSERVIRVTAPNGSPMTGPGTNTYLVGGGQRNEWAVIDPGPDIDTHVRRIIDAAPGPIRWVFVTHTHEDHSPAAVTLKSLTGALLLGQHAPDQEWQDRTFQPDRVLADGDRFSVGDAAWLRAIYTPGHASNHLCYLLEEEKTLFTGDHLMQGSTVVIAPPDGNMAAYLNSLRALLGEDMEWLAPGHGLLINNVHKMIEKTIEHRLMRETKVVAGLRELAPVDIDRLLARVYDDVPEFLHPMAKYSLMAHIGKLEEDGLTREDDGLWAMVGR